jgi:hypothetical protein
LVKHYQDHPNDPFSIGLFSLSSSKLLESYSSLLPLRNQAGLYHVFISYRWSDPKTDLKFDSELVSQLADAFSLQTLGDRGERVYVFYDRHCLQLGSEIRVDFMRAMLKSRVVCPLITSHALEKMCEEQASIDNVLCEWWLALTLLDMDRESDKRLKIMPIFAGEVSRCFLHVLMSADPVLMQVSKNTSAAVPDIANLFKTFHFSRLADHVNRPVQTALNHFLSQYVGKDVTVQELSVKSIVERLLGMSGITCWDLAQPPPQRDRVSAVEEMTIKQIYYEAMPARCAEQVTEALASLPPLDDWDRQDTALSGVSLGARPGSASIRLCTTIEQVALTCQL